MLKFSLKQFFSVFVVLGLFCKMQCQVIAQDASIKERKQEQLYAASRTGTNDHKRVITLDDILSTRKLLDPRISPDGKVIAFIIEQASFKEDENRSTLLIVKTDGTSVPVKLLEEKGLSGIRWAPGGQSITYLSSKSGSRQIWRAEMKGEPPTQLTYHPTGVTQYEWSPDGKKIAFFTSEAAASGEAAEAEARGITFDYSLGAFGMLGRSWKKSKQQLWMHGVLEQRDEKIIEQNSIGFASSEMAWSPDGRKIVVAGLRPLNLSRDFSSVNQDIGYVSLESHEYTPLITWGGVNVEVKWSPDNGAISFITDGGVKDALLGRKRGIMILDLKSGRTSWLNPRGRETYAPIHNRGWSGDGNSIMFESPSGQRSESALYESAVKDGTTKRITQSDFYLSDFSFSSDRSYAACIFQNPTTPPDLAVLNRSDGTLRTLTALHPEYRDIKLSEVSRLIFTNKYDIQSSSFFVKPLNYVEGKHYPLVVILYRFSGEFFTDVFGNYPIQAFAANNFAVLLINIPGLEFHYGNFDEGSKAEAYNPLACIEKGVETVINSGIADPKRVGIMGWSYGSFLTDFAITQTDLFAAASSGDGGLYGANTYWLVSDRIQKFYDGVMGGPPYGSTYANWKRISPSLNANRLRIPVLMEYVDRNIAGVEFYTALRKQGGQADLIVYPNASHVFTQPRQRFYSMERNLDWFNFWLNGKEDTDPMKREQYIRWGAMRQNLMTRQTDNFKSGISGEQH